MQNEELLKLIQENITLLEGYQVKKGRKKLKVLKDYGINAGITDFSILLGGICSEHLYIEYKPWEYEATGAYYLKSNKDGQVQVVYDGEVIEDWANKSIYGVRPIISYSNIPGILSNIKEEQEGIVRSNYDGEYPKILSNMERTEGVFKVEFGEYPQFAVETDKRIELEKALAEGKIKETGKVYHINDNDDSEPTEFQEYEYEGKKYIRIKSVNNYRQRLLTGSYARKDDWQWIEVSPIEWLVDQEKELLISKRILAAGISFSNNKHNYETFESTKVYKFLKELFTKDIMPEMKLENENRSKLETIIRQIYLLQDVMPDKEKTINEVKEIIDIHNQKLDRLREEKEKGNTTVETFDNIVRTTELKLSIILEELKTRREKLSVYYEMLDDVTDYIAILTGKEPKEDNELSDEFYSLEKTIIPFLKEEDGVKTRQQLLEVLQAQKKEIEDYIYGKSNIKYHTVEDMTMDLRREIHPILEVVNNQVNNRDIEKEINEQMQKIITGLYEEPKNKFISIYLTEINRVYTSISRKINRIPQKQKDEYNEEITAIMNRKIDYSKEFIHISRELMKMYLDLSRILNKINSYLDELDRFDEGYINLDEITIDIT